METLYEQPVVQELLSQLNEAKRDLEKEVKLPFIIPNKILMSPGVWNGYFYSREAINDAFLKTSWDKKEIRSLFNDHQDLQSREWIGEVRNPRMEGDDCIGDLHIVDKATAIKLAYGAKMGISPKVSGHEEGGAMQRFIFDNFSVVINPAVKTAYINNAQKPNTECAEIEVGIQNNTEVKKMAEKEVEMAQPEQVTAEMQKPVDKKYPYPVEGAEKKKYPEPSELDQELSAYTDFVKEYIKKHAGASVADAAKAWDKKKMSADVELSDVMQILNDLRKEVAELKDKQLKEVKPAPEPEKKVENNAPIENNEVEELKEKVTLMERKLSEPDKVTQKTQELSDKGDIDAQILSHLRQLSPMEV